MVVFFAMQTGKRGKYSLLLVILLMPLLIGGSVAWFGYRALVTPGPPLLQPVRFFVQNGSSLEVIARHLHAEGLLSQVQVFRLWARLSGVDRKIQHGEYLFPEPLSPLALLNQLSRGQLVHQSITIPEGFSLAQIARLLEQRGFGAAESFLCLNADPQFLADWRLPANSLEGYLYPATYQFSVRASAQEILGTMLARFYASWDLTLDRRAVELGLSQHEVVTLASIIEKETGKAAERPLIASVIHNRLRRGIRLQCDPTVIYGIRNFDGNLTRRHLQTPTPYNTYVIHGLPPGPIANPGLAALRAALYPATTDYLYFVARGDGTHQFSVTLAEHNRAVRRFQKYRSKRHPS